MQAPTCHVRHVLLITALIGSNTMPNAAAHDDEAEVVKMHRHPQSARPIARHEMHSHLPVGITLSSAWDSHYVSEGRDNLDGDSLLGATVELSFGDLMAGVWYAETPNGPYDEFNAYLDYALVIGDIEFHLGYNHLRFMDDDAHDNELSFGVAYIGFACGIVPAVDWVYSFDAEGAFYELSLTRSFEVAPWLVLEPGIVFGINDGYVADGHNGANHVAFSLAATIPVSEQCEIGAYLAYNQDIDSNAFADADDALLNDFLYGGVSLTLSF